MLTEQEYIALLTESVKSEVFLDPAIKDQGCWRVMYKGRICTPDFNSKGAAKAYLDLLEKGVRKPEYGDSNV